MAHAHAAGACVGFGELRRAEAHVARADALEAGGIVDVDWPWTFSARTVLAVNMGRFDDGARLYERGAPEFGAGLVLLVRNSAATAVADVYYLRRQPEPLRALVADFAELNSQARHLKALVLARLDVTEGRVDEGIAAYETALAAAPPESQVALYLAVGLAQLCLRNGRRERAVELIDTVQQQDRAIRTVLSGTLLRWLTATLGDDVEALRAELESVLEYGLLRYEPDIRYELGRLGVETDANLASAHRLYSALGSVDDIAMTEAEMRRQGVRVPSRRQADRYALTDAERKVAELVAEGMTNKAIAEQLAYSVKTIEAYLSRVYAKTGCANRVELTRYLAIR
jgi:DNA-binding CsgD family transcriptional regulator